MKFTTVTAGLLTFSTLGQAAINLTWTPDEVGRIRIGDEIRVSWETDRTYDLEFKFVKWQKDGWKPITTSFQNLRQPAGEGGYVFNVPKVPHNKLYGFWLEGSEIDKNAGHANLTSWFMVNKKGYGEPRDLKA